jgi:Na+-transporting methylmalonyl-CoA/oxaloacetate decarboxylase gamma subunit
VNSPIFGGFITFVIVLNTIVLALNKYPEWSTTDPFFANVLSEMNTSFTIIFSAEVVLKLFGLGVWGYAADKMNLFDCVIVVIAMVELINDKTNPTSDGGGGGPFGALRAVRLFRIFKIFRSGDLRMLLESIILTVAGIKDYIILLLLFIYVWALLGMSFFANKVKFNDAGEVDLINGTPPRTNFDKNYFAFLAVFQIIIGENWNSVMYNHMLAGGEVACIFFIGLVITGNIIMLNLFLAILLGNFERAKQAFDKAKIFIAFEQYLNAGVEINIAIIYLFDDEQFAKYIEEKVLRKDKEDH